MMIISKGFLFFLSCSFTHSEAVQPSHSASASLVRKEGPAVLNQASQRVSIGITHSADPASMLAVSASGTQRASDSTANGGVPRIIHQTFKTRLTNTTYPNPVWQSSEESWKRFYPDGDGTEINDTPTYEYRMWSDDDLNKFFADNCAQHVGQMPAYDNKISVSDMGRYCILYFLGGIYSDLDYEPRANFYEYFASDRVSLVESPYRDETFQNSLMASPPGMLYWLDVMRQAMMRKSGGWDANDHTGPRLLESLRQTHDPSIVHMLPCKLFQRATHKLNVDTLKGCGLLDKTNVNSVLGIHWGTWSWCDPKTTGDGNDNSRDTQHLFRETFKELHPGSVLVEEKPHDQWLSFTLGQIGALCD